jgi:predicted PurR-regulated permease PerM
VFVAAWIGVFLVAILATFSQLVVLIMFALVLSLVIRPMVDWIDRRYPRIPRLLTTLVIYLGLLGGLLAIPISATPGLVRQITTLVNNLPTLIGRIADNTALFLSEPISLFGGRYVIPVNEITVEEFRQLAGNIVTLLGSSATSMSSMISNFATFTVAFLSQTVFVLFLAFWFTKDGKLAGNALVHAAPTGYHEDLHYIISRIGLIWGAFLRGQLTLMLVMGVVVFIVTSILGLPNPVALGVFAGFAELVPIAGPILAAIPAVLLAYFQSDASWIGTLMNPFWFMLIVGGSYWLLQQLENYFLVPRIMGHQLNLHPAVVLVAALAGYQLTGVLGILLAAPTLATLRLFFRFINGKMFDTPILFEGDRMIVEGTVTTETAQIHVDAEITIEDSDPQGNPEWTNKTYSQKLNPSSSGQPQTTENLPTTLN